MERGSRREGRTNEERWEVAERRRRTITNVWTRHFPDTVDTRNIEDAFGDLLRKPCLFGNANVDMFWPSTGHLRPDSQPSLGRLGSMLEAVVGRL
eukprot:5873693-Pyramimonas_sp.AAC.1